MNKIIRFVFIVFLVAILIAIRGFVAPFFYDPLHDYFLGDYLHISIPTINFGRFFLHLGFRYFLNTIVSLGVIYLVFSNLEYLVFSVKFYLLAFLILGLFLFLILYFNINSNMLLFYIRRFLIHPLFVFILLPAFYYQNLKQRN
ncbi:exosortase F system-associated protein [Lutibacter holmesii]|uniref:Exosortase F system-associated protein n=1 Tax=Lutibacter holmesii TaxID=1137985 RepID=A0ABW3WN83_9FLAO